MLAAAPGVVLGIVLGVLATRSSEAHLDTVVVWSALLAATLRYATPLTFAAIGGAWAPYPSRRGTSSPTSG